MTQDKELEELIRNKIGETLKCFLGKEESLIIITALATAILEKYVRRDSGGGKMTTQEQLERIIEEATKKWYELPYQKRDMDSINKWIAEAIHSAMLKKLED